MKQLEYIIQDELGIHARPAGMLVKLAKNYESGICINAKGASADMKKLMALLGLGITKGTSVLVQAEGLDEEAAIIAIEEFFKANL